ncbi:hypothetical protein GOD17_31670 [Sinorhizobium medicae]|nr:hypothetical protein [Sinorhizobium medicae]
MPKNEFGTYTDFLNRHPAENICHAFDFAAWLGCPLNNYIVINFAREDEGRAGAIFRAIRHKYRDWLNRRTRQLYGEALAPMYVYTLENPHGMTHCNWVLHVPPDLQSEFDRKRVRWIERAHLNVRKYDVHPQMVVPGTAKSLSKYIIKGTDSRFVEYLHLENYAEPQGRVWGRRGTASPAISRAARKDAGFVAKRDRGKLRAANDARRKAA